MNDERPGGFRIGRFADRPVIFAGIVLASISYAVGAWDSPLLDRQRNEQLEIVSRHAQIGERQAERERALAEIYWARYADVAVDPFFGRAGSLGIWGAREHFNRYGKREGRRWPKDAARQRGGGEGQR